MIQFDAFAPVVQSYGGSNILYDPGGNSTLILGFGFTSTFSTRGMSLSECPFPLSSTTRLSAFKITTQASQDKGFKLDSLALYDIDLFSISMRPSPCWLMT